MHQAKIGFGTKNSWTYLCLITSSLIEQRTWINSTIRRRIAGRIVIRYQRGRYHLYYRRTTCHSLPFTDTPGHIRTPSPFLSITYSDTSYGSQGIHPLEDAIRKIKSFPVIHQHTVCTCSWGLPFSLFRATAYLFIQAVSILVEPILFVKGLYGL